MLIKSIVILLLLNNIKAVDSQNYMIKNYSEKRDKKFILNAFEKNWDFLVDVAYYGSQFNIKFIEQELFNNIFSKIKVLVINDKAMAFIVYKANFIKVLYVDDKYRRQGYSNILIEYAINDIVKHLKKTSRTVIIGIKVTENNTSALNVYKKLGFKIDDIQKREYLPSIISLSKKIDILRSSV